MNEVEGGVIALDPRRLLTVVLELHQRRRQMKEAEGGTVALDPCRLPMVVLELHRRGHRMKPKGAPSPWIHATSQHLC
jgi:hypothetical protein